MENWETNDEPMHLRYITRKIVEGDQAVRLLGLYREVWSQEVAAVGAVREIDVEGNADEMALLLSGVAVRDGGRVRVYNRVYRKVFNLEWAALEQAKLRPYQEKFNAWRESYKKSDLLDSWELTRAKRWAKGKRLDVLDYEFFSESLEVKMDVLQKRALRAVVGAIVAIGTAVIAWIITLTYIRNAEVQKRQAQESQQKAELERLSLENTRLQFQEEKLTAKTRAASLINEDNLDSEETYLLYKANLSAEIALQHSTEGYSHEALSLSLQAAKTLSEFWERTSRPVNQSIYAYVYYVLHTVLQDFESNKIHKIISSWPYINADSVGICKEEKIFYSFNNGTIKILESKVVSTLFRSLRSDSENINSVKNIQEEMDKISTAIEGHSKNINTIRFNFNCTKMISTSNDGTIRIWEVKTGKEIGSIRLLDYRYLFPPSTDYIPKSASFSPDGNSIVSKTARGNVTIWDITTLWNITPKESESYFSQLPDQSVDAVFSPDGLSVAFASDDRIILWNLGGDKESEFRYLTGHTGLVTSTNFTEDGLRLVSTSVDRTSKIWDIVTGKSLHTLENIDSAAVSASFSPDGQIVASAYRNGDITLWDVKTGIKISNFNSNFQQIQTVEFSSDGRVVIAKDMSNINLGKLKPLRS